MTTQLRSGLGEKKEVTLSGEVEFDEVYVVAGHKGNPQAVVAKGRKGRLNRLKGSRTWHFGKRKAAHFRPYPMQR